jgi:glycosyltransferase involved in cell wall biosynthesis
MRIERPVQIVTLLSHADMSATTLLAASVATHEPRATLHGLACDPSPPKVPGVATIAADALEVDGISALELAAACTADEVGSILIPLSLRAAGASGDPALYAGPDVELTGVIPPALRAVPDEADVVLVRRALPPPDGHRPDDSDLLGAGPVSTALVLAAPSAEHVLTRWASLALHEWARGRARDLGSLLAFLALTDDRVAVIDAPGVMDGWNAGSRGPTTVSMIDFTGWSGDQPHRPIPGPGSARGALADHPEIARLYAARARQLAELGDPGPAPPHMLRAGVVYDGVMRSLYRRELRAFIEGTAPRPPCPLREPDSFVAWIAEHEHGGPVPVSRYIAEIRRGRNDLLDAFPEVPGRSAPDLVRWVIDHGRHELAIPDVLVPEQPAAPEPGGYRQPGVNLAGFLTAELGVGEVARRVASAMAAAGVPYGTYTFERTASRRAAAAPAGEATRFDTNIVCVNADSIGSFVQTVGPAFAAGCHRIGIWFWETGELPAMFHPAYANLDELWAASDFVADALRASAPEGLPVVRFPLPIVEPTVDPEFERRALEIPDGRFTFTFVFDYLSVAARKNPFGLVDAFREAFAPGEGPVLVIKSINGEHRPDDVARLRWHARDRDDVLLRDGYLDAPQVAALLKQTDCFVSLHRSEGFGFNLADSIALGTPVIATGYSGNLTFMSHDDCSLVRYDDVAVGEGHFPYAASSTWADPDLAHAAELMRAHVERPHHYDGRAQLARARVLREFAPLTTGTFIRNRLAGIRAHRTASPATGATHDGHLRELLRRITR